MDRNDSSLMILDHFNPSSDPSKSITAIFCKHWIYISCDLKAELVSKNLIARDVETESFLSSINNLFWCFPCGKTHIQAFNLGRTWTSQWKLMQIRSNSVRSCNLNKLTVEVKEKGFNLRKLGNTDWLYLNWRKGAVRSTFHTCFEMLTNNMSLFSINK